MNYIKFIFALTVLILISGRVKSQSSESFQKSELTHKILNQNSFSETENKLKNNVRIEADKEKKSPYLGALFSGILPGSGEFYAKSFVKAAIFFGIEAGLWTAYAIYQTNGNQQTDDYENFADANWDVYKYGQWLKEQNFSGSEGIDLNANKTELRKQINVCEAQNFSHQLPPYGEQQYYELIGKYQNFVPGWADADLSYVNRNNYGAYKTNMFTSYSYDRQDANSYYDKATTSLTLIIFNHILSSADAAWSVSMFNKSLKVKTGIHLEDSYSYFGEKRIVPHANINVTF